MRVLALSLLLSLFVPAAYAQQDANFRNLAPLPETAMADNAPIRMTPDGPAVIKLGEDAASVIVGNPAQATAILENPRLIMLLPQQPGATKIIALDRNGKTILNKHVLVGGGQKGFIRVNRACRNASTEGCQPVSMFYCPDRCYETSMPAATTDAAPSAANLGGDTTAPAMGNANAGEPVSEDPGSPEPVDEPQ